MKKFGKGRAASKRKKHQKNLLRHGSHGRYGSLESPKSEPTERRIFTRRYAEKKEPAR
jgi:hypothetical protein